MSYSNTNVMSDSNTSVMTDSNTSVMSDLNVLTLAKKQIKDVQTICRGYITLNSSENMLAFLETFIKSCKSNMFFRGISMSTISYGLPNKEVISKIIEFANEDYILEIGAGTGLWSQLIKMSGHYNITPTDKKDDRCFQPENSLADVEKLEHIEALKKYKDHNVLMMIWPPQYPNNMAHETLKNFKGNKFIYCGESEYGCTGTNEFFSELEENWEIYSVIYNPTFDMSNDSTTLYIRNTD